MKLREREREEVEGFRAAIIYPEDALCHVRVPKEGRKEGSQPSANTLVTD